jgi:aldehyde dehydrogenase
MSKSTNSKAAELASGLFQKEYGHFIGGKWEAGASGETIPVLNPATGETLSKVQSGNGEDVRRAVDAAYAAFPKWSATMPEERQKLLLEFAARLGKRSEEYGLMEMLNNGKPLYETGVFDLPMSIGLFEYFAGAAHYLHGTTIDYPHTSAFVHRAPIGVCAAIIPWNVPLIMMAQKLAPALVAGNTVVLKPSEVCGLSVMEFMRDVADILPPGVINVVTGYGQNIGESLIADTRVRKVAFTGSKPTAQAIMGYCSRNITPHTLELGGKSANIICDDADLDAAAEGVAQSTIFNKGEVCLAGSRVFVHEKIQSAFLDKLQRILSNVRVGDPTEMSTQLGPMASRMQFDKVSRYLEIGREEGATVLTGGRVATVPGFERGYFIEPTVFTDVKNSMRIAQEEIFGPVTCVIPWKTDDEVIQLANESTYGLGGGLWTNNLARAHRISRALETGVVWVNRYYNFAPGAPVGGYKQSVIVNLQDGPMGIFG